MIACPHEAVGLYHLLDGEYALPSKHKKFNMHLPLFFEYNLKFIWDILVFFKFSAHLSQQSHCTP